MTRQRRERLVIAAVIAALWAVFLVQAWQTPTLLDDWFQVGWCKDRGLDLELVAQVARYDYLHANPRIGDVFLLLVVGSRAIHLALTPAVQLVLLWSAFVVTFGRRPAIGYRDLELALALQLLIWLACPNPGVVYFYRPFATNYLFAFAAMLCCFAPYRLALAGPPGPRRRWAALPMFALGWLAGMGNEHTAPAAVVAAAGFALWAWRRGRLRAWMVGGALGLGLGCAMLLCAPGQAERYAGRGNHGLLGVIASRGVAGNYGVIAGFLGEAQWAIALALAALLAVVHRRQRDGALPPAMPRDRLFAIAGLVAAAGAILVTLFASPTTTDRVLFAPAVLLAGALAVVVEHAGAAPRARALIAAACAIGVAYHAVRFVEVYAIAGAENRHRIARLRAAPPGTVATVPAYRTQRSRWYPPDDFRIAEVREYVARELFGLAGIELDEHPTWAEATPPGRFVATAVHDPPLPPALAAAHPLAGYTPSSAAAALGQLHRGLAVGGWRAIDGHRLVRYAIDAVDQGFSDPRGRPVHVVIWTPDATAYVESDRNDDRNGQPEIRVSARSAPAGWTEAYLVGCGRTTRIEPRRDAALDELVLPVVLDCRASHTAMLCTADACWFAGRYR